MIPFVTACSGAPGLGITARPGVLGLRFGGVWREGGVCGLSYSVSVRIGSACSSGHGARPNGRQAKTARDRDQARRAARRHAAASERERKRLYAEDRKAEAAAMAAGLQARVGELDSVLTAGIEDRASRPPRSSTPYKCPRLPRPAWTARSRNRSGRSSLPGLPARWARCSVLSATFEVLA